MHLSRLFLPAAGLQYERFPHYYQSSQEVSWNNVHLVMDAPMSDSKYQGIDPVAVRASDIPIDGNLIDYLEYDQPRHARRLFQSASESVCYALGKGTKTVSDICGRSIRVPVSGSPRMCSTDVPIVDNCADKKKYKYPCVKKNLPKMCDGWTCVPGTKMTTVKTYCGVDVNFENRGICPSQVNDMARRAQSTCSCISAVEDLVSSAIADKADSVDTAKAKSEAMNAFIKASNCIIDKLSDIQDNKAERTALINDPTNAATIKFPELNATFYQNLLSRISICVFGDCELLVSLFKDYMQKSIDSIKSGIEFAAVLYIEPLIMVSTIIEELGTSIDSLTESSRSDVIQCVQRNAKSSAITTAARNVLDSLQKVGNLEDEISTIMKTATKVRGLLRDISSYIDNLSQSVPNAANMAKLVDTYSDMLPMMKQILNFPSEFDKIYDAMQDAPAAVFTLRAIVQNINDNGSLLSDNLVYQKCLADSPVGRAISLLERNKNSLNNFKLRVPTVTMGMITYNRWAYVKLQVPCTREASQCFNVAGKDECVNYPEVYACDYSKKISLLNHHIPYLNIKFK